MITQQEFIDARLHRLKSVAALKPPSMESFYLIERHKMKEEADKLGLDYGNYYDENMAVVSKEVFFLDKEADKATVTYYKAQGIHGQ